ncbi:MAG: helix-turn-helix domain-containing protein [Oliverpabstia sp.]|nr:helix-turn-helix domain-containing protein [Oliverpabstia sp.]
MEPGCGMRTQKDVGELVEQWREKNGWTQATLAGYLGISVRHYYRICVKCDNEFTTKQVKILSKILGISADELIPDVELCQDDWFLNNIEKMSTPVAQQGDEMALMNIFGCNNENGKRIIEYVGAIMKIKDKELQEDFINQLEGLAKLSIRLDRNKKY